MQKTGQIYVLGDGDKIRERVEYHLFNHDTENLKKFSQSLTEAINEIKVIAISTMDAQVIIAGGDDILFYVSSEKYQRAIIQRLRETFYDIAGITISFGVGNTIEAAYINVRRAKVSKVVKIIEEEE